MSGKYNHNYLKVHGKLIVLSHQKEQNIIDLCHAIAKLVCEIGLINTDIHQKAIDIAINFKRNSKNMLSATRS